MRAGLSDSGKGAWGHMRADEDIWWQGWWHGGHTGVCKRARDTLSTYLATY